MNFYDILKRCLHDLNRYIPSENIQKILKKYDNFDFGIVCFKYHNVMKEFDTDLKNGKINESMFNNSLIILPGVDLHIFWKKLSNKQKEKIWTKLRLIYISSDNLMNSPDRQRTQSNTTEKKTTSDAQHPARRLREKQFNPYEGIGKSNKIFGIDEVYSGPDELPGQEKSKSMFDINKILKLDGIKDHFKNMSKEDIDNATSTITQLMGKNVSSGATNLISDLIHSIKDEIASSDNLDIMDLAKKLTKKIGPKLKNNKKNVDELLKSAQNMTQNMMGGMKLNPNTPMNFDTIQNIMGNLMGNKNFNMSKQDFQECNRMMGNMGMPTIPMQSRPQRPQRQQRPQSQQLHSSNRPQRPQRSRPQSHPQPQRQSNVSYMQRKKNKKKNKKKRRKNKRK
uniref:Uncharacterized protein n=1 Tax=Mimivirus LCMiAC02 TaxID=2506609 RepID=A0A4D5XEV4_9VIRU|nr:MAG: hypothetical protein LCMiAC02_03800 [Mimivirus LCMiAC02]